MNAELLPRTMRAMWWTGPGQPLTVRDIAAPVVENDGDVIVRVRAAVFGAALVRATTVGHPNIKPPGVLGTLIAGDVVAHGASCEHLEIGTRVTLDPHPPCYRCACCRADCTALCEARHRVEPGSLSQMVRVPPPLACHLHPIPESLSYESAVYTEIVACVIEATRVAAIKPGDTVVVLGCGPVALIQIQIARMCGASHVLCFVNHRQRLQAVRAVGAEAIYIEDEDPRNAVVRRTTGGSDVVFEAVGKVETYSLALELVRPGGTVVGFGGCPPGSRLSLDLNLLHYRGIRFIGSYHYRAGTFERALRLLADGCIRLDSVLSHRLPLEQIAEAPDISSAADCFALIIKP